MVKTENVIKEVKSVVLEIPLKNEWKISLYASQKRAHLFVRIATNEGIIGYGEASPSLAFMGETAYTMKEIVDKHITPILLGQAPFCLEKIHSMMNKSIEGNFAAKSAIDIALHDLMGKILKQPVYNLIGGMYQEWIPLTWVVGIKSIENSITEAKQKFNEGFTVIKIKIGEDPNKDINLIKALRESFGAEIKIRLDANQGYLAAIAKKTLRVIEEFGIECVEQPVARWDVAGLKEVKDAIKIPILADELVSNLHEAFKIIGSQAADLINIKIGKVGGLYQAKKIAAIVEAAGISATVGSNLELGIGSAANLHFITSSRAVSYPNDALVGLGLHEYDVAQYGFEIKNGMARCSSLPGLGVKVNDEIFR